MKWIHQGEQIIIIGDWNSEESEVNTWIEKQELTKKICNLQRYSDDQITYQQSKDCPIDGMYYSATLAENRGVGGWLLSFGRLVVDHQSMCIEVHESMLLGFWHHDIIPPMAWDIRLGDPRTINKFNDTLHRSF